MPHRPLIHWLHRCAAPVAVGTTLLCGACTTVGPDYRPPRPIEVAAWQSAEAWMPGRVDSESLVRWWQGFDDPQLTTLIERALEANPDLEAARARVRQARALLLGRRVDLLPTVDAGASALTTGTSEATASGIETEIYQARFDAAWELDLFGGLRRSVEAAVADLQATAYDLDTFRVSLAAEVASAYVDLRTFQARVAIAEANRDAQQETFELASSRFEAGLVGRLDVEQARSNLESTRSQIPTLRIGLEQSMHRVAVLTGEAPGARGELRSTQGAIPKGDTGLAVGVPAEALRRRPDVGAAERRLAAETARIGVAMAELYPKFRLTGTVGLEALDLDGLTDGGSSFFNFGPSFSWRVFDRRSIRSGIEAQDAVQEQALHSYEAAVLTALEDVENTLVAYSQEQLRREALDSAAQAAGRAADLARDLYRAGLRDFQDVLDSQRSLLTFEDSLAVSEGAVTQNLIRLYKALGGGWTPEKPPEASPTEGRQP